MRNEYDAIFIHGQGYHESKTGMPSKRGTLQANAVKVLHEKGFSFGRYVFSGIPIGKDNMAMSQVSARELHRRTGISPDLMIIDETARTTSMEVAFSSRQAEINGWKRVAHLTYGEVHPDQIRQHVALHFGEGTEVDVFRADEVLTDPIGLITPQALRNLQRFQNYVEVYNASETEQGILNYERPKNTFMGWKGDLGNKLLNLASRFYRPDPAVTTDTSKQPVEPLDPQI